MYVCKRTDLISAINDINNFTANTKAAKKGRIKLQSSSHKSSANPQRAALRKSDSYRVIKLRQPLLPKS